MKARHIYYGLGALVLSGQPLLAWVSYQFSEDSSGIMLPFWRWLISWWGLFSFSLWVLVLATGYLVSCLASTRAVRIAGLVAMPLATLAVMLPAKWAMRWAMQNGLLENPPSRIFSAVIAVIVLLIYPVFAGVLCWLVARITTRTHTSLGEAADA